jgi:sugar lactone lactonase YvrE
MATTIISSIRIKARRGARVGMRGLLVGTEIIDFFRARFTMTFSLVLVIALFVATIAAGPMAVAGDVTTIAGTGVGGFSGDEGPALAAQLNGPRGLALAPDGAIFFADNANFRIRRISPSGTITTLAGNGTVGDLGDGGPATSASLSGFLSIALDAAKGLLYIGDIDNNRVRKVDLATGVIENFAGVGLSGVGFSGDGGPATSAEFGFVEGVALDSAGNVYIADLLNCRVRRVDTAGIINTIAGTSACVTAGDGGPATAASFESPRRIAIDANGNVFVVDQGVPNVVRRIDAGTGIITTVAGGGATVPGSGPATSMELGFVNDVGIDNGGNLLIVSSTRVFRVNLVTGVLSVFAGTGTASFSGDGGPALSATFSGLSGVALRPTGETILSDADNNRIRSVAPDGPINGGDITIIGTDATVIDLGNLTTAGDVTIEDNAAATAIDLGELTSTTGSVSVNGNAAATAIDLGSLTSAGGSVSVDGNAAATAIDLPNLTTVGGSVSVDGNAAATSISLPSLTSTGGSVSVAGNAAATAIDLGSLTSAGGSVSVDGNAAATGIDLSSLDSVDGDVIITDNPNADVELGSLTTVTGDITVVSRGTGTFVVGDASAGGDMTLTLTDYGEVSGTTAAGTTAVENKKGADRMTLTLPPGASATPTPFTMTRRDPASLPPEAGTDAAGDPALIDPVSAYTFSFAVPDLAVNASLAFIVEIATLDPASAAALLAGLATGNVTMVAKADAPGSGFQAFPICSGGVLPSPDGCVTLELLDAAGDPTLGTPAFVRFSSVVSHFSTWGVAVIAPPPPEGPCHLLGHWQFDSFSGRDSFDGVHGIPATLVGNATSTSAGFLGKGVKMAYNGLVGISAIDTALPAFTVSVFVKPKYGGPFTVLAREGGDLDVIAKDASDPDSDGGLQVFGRGYANAGNRQWIFHRGLLRGWGSRIGGISTFTNRNAQLNQWQHLAVVYTRTPTQADAEGCGRLTIAQPPLQGLLKVYVNGTLRACQRRTEENANGALLLGAKQLYDNSKRGDFNGVLDEFALFDRLLTNAEVATLAAPAASSDEMRTRVLGTGGTCE